MKHEDWDENALMESYYIDKHGERSAMVTVVAMVLSVGIVAVAAILSWIF